MDALIYGIIPKANIAAFLNAPPTKRSYKPKRVLSDWFLVASANKPVSIPGSVIWAPILTTIRSNIVNIILCLNS